MDPTVQSNSVAPNSAGPGSVVEQDIQPDALLAGASEHEYITILNILPVDFIGVVAQERPINVPFELRQDGVTQTNTHNEGDAARNYGLNLKNKDHTAKGRITNRVTIPTGKTINLLGNEAQVIVRQLVTEVLQRQGKKLMLADAYQRRLIEEQIVVGRSPVSDILGGLPISQHEQNKTAVDNLNKTEAQDEQQFPTVDPGEPAEEAQTGNKPSRGAKKQPRDSDIRTSAAAA